MQVLQPNGYGDMFTVTLQWGGGRAAPVGAVVCMIDEGYMNHLREYVQKPCGSTVRTVLLAYES